LHELGGTVSQVLRDSMDALHPRSPVVKLGILHPRKKKMEGGGEIARDKDRER